MIIDRYLIRQVVRPFVAVCLVLVLVFAGYSSSLFLGAASQGIISRDSIARLIALKTMIALDVLVPISLYLTVIVGLGQLYANREMTALRACGFGTSRVLRAVLGVVVPVALLTGLLSIFGRPWAYTKIYALRAQAEESIDLAHMEGGSFYFDRGRNRVLFADKVKNDGRLEGVFIALGVGDKRRIISARRGRIVIEKGEQSLVLEDLHIYSLDSKPFSVAEVGRLEWPVTTEDSGTEVYRRKAEPTTHLLRSSRPADLAELQWRLSRPISTLFLGLLAVFLSETDPRRGRYARVLSAMFIYIIYYGSSIVARSWVEHGTVGALPGMWWVDLLLGGVVGSRVMRAIRVAGEGRSR